MSYIFGERHRAYMRRAYHSVINVAEGAVRAGKTVDNVFVFAALLEDSPDRFHLATGSTLGNAKMNLGECNGLGLEHIFKGRCRWTRYRDNEALAVHTKRGERIVIFAGGKNADSYKKIRGNSYGMWIATEINLHADSFIREAFNRQLAARERRIFWDLNPSSPSSPIYTDYLDRYEAMADENPGYYNYAHFTIFDNPVIPEERIREITAQYDPASVWYRRDILGQRCAAEGLIYRLFADDPAKFTRDTVDPGEIDFVNIGVDFGGNRSRTTFAAAAFLRHSGITVIGEHAVAGGKGEIDSSRINVEFGRFLADLRQRYPGVRIRYVFADSEAQYLINGLRRYVQENDGGVRVMDSAKRPIVDRIAFVNTLMSSGRFSLTKECVLLRAGLASAVWDENADGDKRLDNFSTDIDILDAFEYAVERYMTSMK
ncbi:MAG: phage terminase large subunit [Clostridia bacterium]|nr:phage terminase large subunit [Clostridia bacterium]MBQ8511576.1 phage terminase large subunit [Clostridia bacterium]